MPKIIKFNKEKLCGIVLNDELSRIKSEVERLLGIPAEKYSDHQIAFQQVGLFCLEIYESTEKLEGMAYFRDEVNDLTFLANTLNSFGWRYEIKNRPSKPYIPENSLPSVKVECRCSHHQEQYDQLAAMGF